MFIKNIAIENFKWFSRKQKIEFNYPNWEDKWLNFFVWENNTWKSTVFEAVDFLFNWIKSWKDISSFKNKNNVSGDLSIEIEMIWNLSVILDAKYSKYILNKWEEWNEILKLSRTSKESTVRQWTKDVEINIKKLWIWNYETSVYENPTWIDKTFLKYFDMDFIWADTNPSDSTKFWSTTIVWKLINRISDWFKDTDWYKEFEKKYNKVFNEEEESLKSKLKEIWGKAENIFKNQFWEAKINFHFENLDINSFLKNTKIEIDDWTKTYLDEKWSWMQRAVALTLLQVYIEMTSDTDSVQKPFYFFIDEPEICLHPLAQIKLIKALNKLSETQQIFLTTHSPYIFKETWWKLKSVEIFTKNNEEIKIENTVDKIWLFWKYSPTWWEINYYAYNLPTIEFHNELYWFLEENKKDRLNGINKTKNWIKNFRWEMTNEDISLQWYIRHSIHHPENNFNEDYTEDELKNSIDFMISLLD